VVKVTSQIVPLEISVPLIVPLEIVLLEIIPLEIVPLIVPLGILKIPVFQGASLLPGPKCNTPSGH
jgi:hypothetical protein